MQSAVVQNGAVIAIVDGATNSLGTILPGASIVTIPDGTAVAIGDLYAGGVFSKPVPVTVMSKRDFMTRFAQAEAVAIL